MRHFSKPTRKVYLVLQAACGEIHALLKDEGEDGLKIVARVSWAGYYPDLEQDVPLSDWIEEANHWFQTHNARGPLSMQVNGTYSWVFDAKHGAPKNTKNPENFRIVGIDDKYPEEIEKEQQSEEDVTGDVLKLKNMTLMHNNISTIAHKLSSSIAFYDSMVYGSRQTKWEYGAACYIKGRKGLTKTGRFYFLGTLRLLQVKGKDVSHLV